MKLVNVIRLFLSVLAVSGYNINHERSTVYKNAIAKSLKKPIVSQPMQTSTAVIPMSPRRSSPVKYTEKLAGPPNYWFHPKIHTFGNTGFLGGLHAAMAPLATFLIDMAAYDGENVRDKISRQLRKTVDKAGANVVDLCCGVGTSTRALRKFFGDANTILGVDTSKEMIAMAELLSTDNLVAKTFASNSLSLEGACDPSYTIANSEQTTLPDASFDLVTIMYAFHEAPYLGRYRMLREARRLLAPGGTLAVVDISPLYEPSPTMLAGEPYVLEYKKNIQKQMSRIQGFERCTYSEVVKGHVGKWILTRKKDLFPTRWYSRPLAKTA